MKKVFPLSFLIIILLFVFKIEIAFNLPKRADNLKEFIEWCSKNQVPANKFEIKRIKDDEYGLFATSNHNENDVLFEISRKVFMTNETAAADIKLSMFVLKIIDLDWNNNFIL